MAGWLSWQRNRSFISGKQKEKETLSKTPQKESHFHAEHKSALTLWWVTHCPASASISWIIVLWGWVVRVWNTSASQLHSLLPGGTHIPTHSLLPQVQVYLKTAGKKRANKRGKTTSPDNPTLGAGGGWGWAGHINIWLPHTNEHQEVKWSHRKHPVPENQEI